MLVPNHRKYRPCRFSTTPEIQGECCCTCIHRHLLIVGGIPMKYVCKVVFDKEDAILVDLGTEGHGLCEMYYTEQNK